MITPKITFYVEWNILFNPKWNISFSKRLQEKQRKWRDRFTKLENEKEELDTFNLFPEDSSVLSLFNFV